MSGFQYRPISQLNTPMPPGVSAQQAFANRPVVAPGSIMPGVSAQQAFANRPGGVPGAMPPSPSPAVTPGAAVPPASTTPPSLFSRAKDAVKLAGKGIGFLGKATPLLYAAQPLEANAGEADALAKLRLIDGLNLTGQELQLARDLAMSPKVSLERFTSKYFPASTAVASAPPPPSAGGAGTPGISGIDLSAFKPRSAAEEARAAEDFEASQIAAGKIRSKEDIQKDLEAFRTEGKTRAETDRTAAKEAFKENILLNAALAAPQFLKGSGLAQATARFGETFAPMALQTAAEKSKAIKQANVAERESQDKFRLAQIDLNKAKRAESLGNYDKARSLSLDSIKTYATAVLDKYKSDAYVTASTGAYDRMLVGKQYDLSKEALDRLYMSTQFNNASPEMKEEMIRVRVQSMFQIRPGIGGLQTNRPPIQNVPD
jgi:hypothetical protein